MKRLFFVLGLTALAAGCGGSSGPTGSSGAGQDGGSTGSFTYFCEMPDGTPGFSPAAHRCAAITDPQSYSAAQVAQLCQGVGGTPASSCPTAGRVGSCAFVVSNIGYNFSFYQDDPDVPLTKQNCASLLSGTWTDG